MQTILIFSAYSCGSSALAGFFERCGAHSCPPHAWSNDERTKISFENIHLKRILETMFPLKKEEGKEENFFKQKKILISHQNINFIVNKCNGDRDILENELKKIEHFSKNKKEITFDDLMKLINLSENHGISELIDNCLAKNQKKTLNILNENLKKLNQNKYDFVFYVAGVDVHHNDRLGKLKITDEGINKRDQIVIENFYSKNIPLCGVLGGGYNNSFDKLIELHSMLHKNCAEYF